MHIWRASAYVWVLAHISRSVPILLCCRHRSLQLPAPPSLSTIFSPHTALRLPGTPLEYYYIRAMEIHAIVMTLNLETSTQIATFES